MHRRTLALSTSLALALTLVGLSASAAMASTDGTSPEEGPTGIYVDRSFPRSGPAEFAGHGGTGFSGPAELSPPTAPTPRVSSCDTWRNAVAIPGGYKNSVAGCALIGTTNSTSVFYKWERTGGSNGSKACVQGKGFNSLHAPVWQNAGCGTSGSTALLWGNVAATKQIRMFASAGLTVTINWR